MDTTAKFILVLIGLSVLTAFMAWQMYDIGLWTPLHGLVLGYK